MSVDYSFGQLFLITFMISSLFFFGNFLKSPFMLHGVEEQFKRLFINEDQHLNRLENWEIGAGLHHGTDYSHIKIQKITNLEEIMITFEKKNRDTRQQIIRLSLKKENKSICMLFYRPFSNDNNNNNNNDISHFLSASSDNQTINNQKSKEINTKVKYYITMQEKLNFRENFNKFFDGSDAILHFPNPDNKEEIIVFGLTRNRQSPNDKEILIEFINDYQGEKGKSMKIQKTTEHENSKNKKIKEKNENAKNENITKPWTCSILGKSFKYKSHSPLFGFFASIIVDHGNDDICIKKSKNYRFNSAINIKCDIETLLRWFLVFSNRNSIKEIIVQNVGSDSNIKSVFALIHSISTLDLKILNDFGKLYDVEINILSELRIEHIKKDQQHYTMKLSVFPNLRLLYDKVDIIEAFTKENFNDLKLFIFKEEIPDKNQKYQLFNFVFPTTDIAFLEKWIKMIISAKVSHYSYQILHQMMTFKAVILASKSHLLMPFIQEHQMKFYSTPVDFIGPSRFGFEWRGNVKETLKEINPFYTGPGIEEGKWTFSFILQKLVAILKENDFFLISPDHSTNSSPLNNPDMLSIKLSNDSNEKGDYTNFWLFHFQTINPSFYLNRFKNEMYPDRINQFGLIKRSSDYIFMIQFKKGKVSNIKSFIKAISNNGNTNVQSKTFFTWIKLKGDNKPQSKRQLEDFAVSQILGSDKIRLNDQNK